MNIAPALFKLLSCVFWSRHKHSLESLTNRGIQRALDGVFPHPAVIDSPRRRSQETGQLFPLITVPPCRQALQDLFQSVTRFYLEKNPQLNIDAPISRLLVTMHEISQSDDGYARRHALREAIKIITPLPISADPDIAKALKLASRTLIALQDTQRLITMQSSDAWLR